MHTHLERALKSNSRPDVLKDLRGRRISYLRLSVTDRCNLRCIYCRSGKALEMMSHAQILTYEESLELIAAAVELGISKVRLTGGEPFIRRNFMQFLEQVLARHPQLNLRLTTNATLLNGKIPALKDLGVRALNISLDTLQREKFQRITGRDFYFQVRRAIDHCLENQLRVKINVVALKGVNDDELAAFLDLATRLPLDVRFIEFMPVGRKTVWSPDRLWTAGEIVAQAQEIVELQLVQEQGKFDGPVKMFTIVRGQGRLGVISPMSAHFCGECNRLRITSDGRLRTCLFSDYEYRLRSILRSPKLGREHLRRIILLAGRFKPVGADLLVGARLEHAVCSKGMSAIGG
jgi:cyclic pyranopterin phosphate synthase